MYSVKSKSVGCEQVWEVISEKLGNVIFKSNDVSTARKYRERLVEECISRAKYLPEAMTLTKFTWCSRKGNVYLKLITNRDGYEKIYIVNPHCNTEEEKAEMITDGIDLALVYDIVRDYLK